MPSSRPNKQDANTLCHRNTSAHIWIEEADQLDAKLHVYDYKVVEGFANTYSNTVEQTRCLLITIEIMKAFADERISKDKVALRNEMFKIQAMVRTSLKIKIDLLNDHVATKYRDALRV
jgi:hypothetical protein